jgi:hypothetical protein
VTLVFVVSMHPQKRVLVGIILAGGLAVLGSYVYSLVTHPASSATIWGGVPQEIRPAYTVSMLLAALGYFAFTHLILFRLDADTVRIAGRLGFGVFNAIYASILFPSAAWMPLTFAMLERPSAGLWLAIRLVLAAVGLASTGLVIALLSLKPCQPDRAYWLAFMGSIAFCFQTGVLDALVWTALFPL